MGDKVSVGIIDDHKLFRSGVEDIINDSDLFRVVLSANDGDEFFNILKYKPIDILLLDINLKGENGLDVLVQLGKQYPVIKVVMLTMHNEAAYIQTMIQKGAKGYLMKDTTPEILLMTLSKVHQEGRFYDSYTTNILVESLQSKEKLTELGVELSSLEIEILRLISTGQTADEIGLQVYKSTRTVEGYRQKLLEKTKSRNIAELVSWGYKNKML